MFVHDVYSRLPSIKRLLCAWHGAKHLTQMAYSMFTITGSGNHYRLYFTDENSQTREVKRLAQGRRAGGCVVNAVCPHASATLQSPRLSREPHPAPPRLM